MIGLGIKFHKPKTKQGAIMRKILIIMTIIMSTALMGQIRLSADMAGTGANDVLGSPDSDTKLGITLGYDHVLGSSGSLDYGAGLSYQLDRGSETTVGGTTYDGGKFGFTTISGFLHYNYSESIYTGSRLGYAIMFSGDDDFNPDDADLKGGIGWDAHFGYNINDQMGVELSYNSNDGSMEAGSTTVKVRYTRVRISFLYSL